MRCAIIYLRFVIDDKKLNWINYCFIFNALPNYLKNKIKIIVDEFNNEFKDDIIVPLTYSVQNGCVIKEKRIKEISSNLYLRYHNMLSELINGENIRLIYSIGNINDLNYDSIHKLRNEKLVVKTGRYLDKYDEHGIFKI